MASLILLHGLLTTCAVSIKGESAAALLTALELDGVFTSSESCEEVRFSVRVESAQLSETNSGQDNTTEQPVFRESQQWQVDLCQRLGVLGRQGIITLCHLQACTEWTVQGTCRDAIVKIKTQGNLYEEDMLLLTSHVRLISVSNTRIFERNSRSVLVCDSSCLTCTDSTPTGCLTCYPNAEKIATSECHCVSGFAGPPEHCTACDVSCLTCAQPADASQCLTCKSTAAVAAAPGLCVCPDGTYPAPTAATCSTCNSQCLTCSGPQSSECQSCKAAASLSAAAPASCTCDAFYYPNADASNCSLCDVSCGTCDSDLACLTCIVPAIYNIYSFFCECSELFYPNPNPRACLHCHQTCFGCTNGSASACKGCYQHAHLEAGACVCDSSFFPSPLTDKCKACHSTCLECVESSPTDCTDCRPNAYLSLAKSCDCDTGYYFVFSPPECVACHASCLTCSDGSEAKCTQCFAGATLASAVGVGPCVCDAGRFPNLNAATCTACDSSCRTCSSATQCTSCFGAAVLVGPACVCQDGFYGSASSCQPCHDTCATCSGPTECAGCQGPATLSAGVCVCPPATDCLVCDATCKACSGVGAAHCTLCYTHASLSAGSNSNCVCDVSYFPNPTTSDCTACTGGCKSCYSAASDSCYECFANAALQGPAPSACVCFARYFPDPSPANCSPCQLTCASCDDTGSCLSCFPSAVLSAGQCTCVESYFPNLSAASCSACHLSCKSCTGNTLSDCTSCFPQAELQGGTCVCVTHYFPDPVSNHCSLCHPTCYTCDSGSSSECWSCYSGAGLPVGRIRSGCSCLLHHYTLSDAAHCLPCNPACYSCVDGGTSDCTKCYTSAHLSGGNRTPCVCDLYYYPAPHSGTCAPCHYSCAACSGPTDTDCTSCDINATFAASKCTCNEGYYMTTSGPVCYLCHSSCKGCSDFQHCTTCYPNTEFKVSGATKYCVCLEAFYQNPTPQSCSPCFPTCRYCTGDFANMCSSCYACETLSSSNTCDCQVSCFRLTPTSHCQSCHSTCYSCAGGNTADKCTACYAYAQLASGFCVCQIGYFPSPAANNCVACHILCVACSGPALCSECKANASLQTPGIGACACNSNSYFDSTSCVLCHPTCLTCTGSSASSCSDCGVHATKQSGQCVCDTGYYMQVSLCLKCSTPCATCNGGSISDCLSCISALATLPVTPGSCVCPAHYHLELDTGECEYCERTCRVCIGVLASECSVCYPNAALDGLAVGQCTCLRGFYPAPHAGKCTACHSTCRLCIGGSTVDCLDCFDFAIISGTVPGACACEEHSYPDPDVSRCKQCHHTCLTCSGPSASQCIACRLNAFFHVQPPCICTPGFYPNPDSSLCSVCAPDCETCRDPVTCTSCRIHAELRDDWCYCVEDAFPDPDAGHCTLCPEGCSECFALGCIQCNPHLYYLDYQCYAVCPRGYEGSPDFYCIPADMSPPVPTLAVTANNTLSISFDRVMNFTLSASDLSIEVATIGGLEIEVVWPDPIFPNRSSFLVPLTFQVNYLPLGCSVNVTFLSAEKVVSTQDVPIAVRWLTGVLLGYGEPPRNASKTLQDNLLTQQTATAARGAVASSVITSAVNGGPSTFITLVNQIQLITYLAMSKLPLATDFASTLAALNVESMMPNPFSSWILPISENSGPVPPNNVLNYGLDSAVFFTNAYTFLATSLGILVAYVPVYMLSKSPSKAVSEYCKRVLNSLRWTTPLNLWLTSYLDIGVQSCLQLYCTRSFPASPYVFSSLAAAVFCCVVFCVSPVALAVFLLKKYSLLASRCDETFNSRWQVLFLQLKPDGKVTTLAFFLLFLVRRVALTVTLTLLPDELGLFAVLNTSLAVIVSCRQTFLHLVLARPLADRLDQAEASMLEGSTTLVYIVASAFALDLSEKAQAVLDQLGTWAVRLAVAMNLGFALLRVGLTLAQLAKSSKKAMRALQYEVTEVSSAANRGLEVATERHKGRNWFR